MPSLYADVNTLNSILDTYTPPSSEGECYSRIEDLTNLREEALSKGFDKGFFPPSVNMEGLSAEDKRDVAKQMKDLRYAWYLKRATLRRMSFALASYKIALFHFKHALFTDLLRYLPYDGRFLVKAIKSKAPIASVYFDILNLLKGEVVQVGISVDILIPSEEGGRVERIQLYGVNNVSEYVSCLLYTSPSPRD